MTGGEKITFLDHVLDYYTDHQNVIDGWRLDDIGEIILQEQERLITIEIQKQHDKQLGEGRR